MKRFFIAVSLRIVALFLVFFVLFAFANVLRLPAFGHQNAAQALAVQPMSLLKDNRFLNLHEQSRLTLEQLVSTGADETALRLLQDVHSQTNELLKQFASQPALSNSGWIQQYLQTCANVFSLLLSPGEWSERAIYAQKLVSLRNTLLNWAQEPVFSQISQQYGQSLPVFDDDTLLLQAYLSVLLRRMQQQETQSHMVSISFGGNLSLQSGLDTQTPSAFEEEFLHRNTSLSFALGGFAPVLKTDSFSLINLQDAYTSNPSLQEPSTRAMPDFAQMLLLGGIEGANLKSHALLNCPASALQDTKSQLGLYGIAGVEATPLLQEIDGICFGFMGFAAYGNTQQQLEEQIDAGLKELKAQGAQACILLFDWEGTTYSSALSHYCIDAGADMVVGFGTAAQDAITYKGKPIVSSLGVCYPGDGTSYQDTPFLFRQSFVLDASGQVQPVKGMRFDLAPSQETTPCWDFGLDVQILFEE